MRFNFTSFDKFYPTHQGQGQCPWVSQLHQLSGEVSVSLWLVELGDDQENHSESMKPEK
jgi:hypothetical protein